jgi:DNA-binding NarL/FixJ family response regulator
VTGPPVRVAIVDDQVLVRAGFRKLLESESGIEVVGEAADGRAAIELCRSSRIEVALMDIRMPEVDGVAATREITRCTSTRVLVLTTYDLDEYVFAALEAGASGFLLKDSPPDDLVRALHVVAGGESLLAPKVTRRLVDQFVHLRSAYRDATTELARLTEREREVLPLLARGQSNAEIAARLHVGETTVKTHVAAILTKLGVRDRVHAVVFAYEAGIVRPGRP